MKTYNQVSQSAGYREDEISVNLTVCGGSYGGGSEVLVVQAYGFKPRNGAGSGSIGFQEEIAPTLNADGGSCEGGVLITAFLEETNDLSASDRDAQSGRPSGELQRTGRI